MRKIGSHTLFYWFIDVVISNSLSRYIFIAWSEKCLYNLQCQYSQIRSIIKLRLLINDEKVTIKKGDDKLNTIKSMSSSEHGVIVVAWPKTGNHFLMAIWMRWACPVSRTCRASKVVMSPTSMVNCSRRRLHLERIHALRRKWPRRLGQLCYPIHVCGHVTLCASLKANY